LSIEDWYRKYKEPESRKMHDELFKTTTEYNYHMFGVAYGMYIIYELLGKYKEQSDMLYVNELMKIIKSCAELSEKEINTYFSRLVGDIETK